MNNYITHVLLIRAIDWFTLFHGGNQEDFKVASNPFNCHLSALMKSSGTLEFKLCKCGYVVVHMH